MGDVLSFIKRFEEQGLSSCMSDPSKWPDVKNAKTLIQNLDEAERLRVKRILKEILKSIEMEECSLTQKKEEIQKGLKQNETSRKACIAYLRSASAKGKTK